jgi:hypothetical protein
MKSPEHRRPQDLNISPEKQQEIIDVADIIFGDKPYTERPQWGYGDRIKRNTSRIRRYRSVAYKPPENRTRNEDTLPTLELSEESRASRVRKNIFKPREAGEWSPPVYTFSYYKKYSEQGHAEQDAVDFTLETAHGSCYVGGDKFLMQALRLNECPTEDVFIQLLHELEEKLKPQDPA